MKYIRTKDGIFRYEIWEKDIVDFYVKAGTLILGEKTDGKIADTIEELCDEFVSVSSIVKVINNRLEIIKILANKGDVIYGAIWTDKGLIYVAKMNDKGELELL